MKVTYETTTKLGTGIRAKEYSDVVEITVGDQELSVCVSDIAELYEIIVHVKEDIEKYPDDFEVF